METIKNFKNWTNVQKAYSSNKSYRFNTYIYQCAAPNIGSEVFEIQILYWAEDTDILTAKASLFKCVEKDTGKNGIVFERKCVLEEQPVFECVNTAANAVKLNNEL